jgi:hypothetical protein
VAADAIEAEPKINAAVKRPKILLVIRVSFTVLRRSTLVASPSDMVHCGIGISPGLSNGLLRPSA